MNDTAKKIQILLDMQLVNKYTTKILELVSLKDDLTTDELEGVAQATIVRLMSDARHGIKGTELNS